MFIWTKTKKTRLRPVSWMTPWYETILRPVAPYLCQVISQNWLNFEKGFGWLQHAARGFRHCHVLDDAPKMCDSLHHEWNRHLNQLSAVHNQGNIKRSMGYVMGYAFPVVPSLPTWSYGFKKRLHPTALRLHPTALGAGLPTPSKGVACCPSARGIHLSSDVLNPMDTTGKLIIFYQESRCWESWDLQD